SRDRLKQGAESSYLRQRLAKGLLEGELAEIYKRRKDAISVESAGDDSVLQRFAETLPLSPELRNLLAQSFKMKDVQSQRKPKETPTRNRHATNERPTFNPKRFPSFFKLDAKAPGDRTVLDIPLGGSRTLRFQSDVENEYFDRTEEPGDLKIA